MNVPLADLRAQYLRLQPEIDSAIRQILESSQFILGKAVRDFEEEFARFHTVKHCIAVGSGTDALHAALWCLGIGPGDKVVTTPFTFIATVEAISLTGAQPLFVDIDPRTYTMDPAKLEKVFAEHGGKIKAIIPIHLYGHPAPMKEIMEIAKRHHAFVIEDACQAHASKLGHTYVGAFGDMGCFSFYPGKNLGAYGEAGAIVTNNDAHAAHLRKLRDHGQSEKYKHEFWGHNYRMDGIQGAVLGVKLKHLKEWTERRRTIGARYSNALRGVGDLAIPTEMPDAYHVYHVYALRTVRRTQLQQHLTTNGIGCALHYPIPIHFQEAYKNLGYRKGDFPVSEGMAEECISLPLYAEMTDEQVSYVIDTVKKFFQD